MDSSVRQRMTEFYRSSLSYYAQLASHEVESATYFVEWLASFVPAGSSILDVGCGTGFSTHLLCKHGYSATGVDLSELFITTHRSTVEAQFAVSDALDLPFSAGSFDAVASAALVEHLPDVAQALREMLRVLRPGGLLLVLAPNHCSLTMPIYDLMNTARGHPGRPYFAESPQQAFGRLMRNIRLNVAKLLSSQVEFCYVEPNLTVGTGGDHDMVYYASPIDLRRSLRRQGATIENWSGVKTGPLVANGRLRLRGSGVKKTVIQSLFWPFTGMTFVVARKLGDSR